MIELLDTAASHRKVRNEAERATLRAVREQLSDGWRVIPNVEFDLTPNWRDPNREYELDIVVAHPRVGFAIIETKGHSDLVIRGGEFFSRRGVLDKQPGTQLRRNTHGLQALLGEALGTPHAPRVAGLIAFPNQSSLVGDLPPNLSHSQILLADDLDSHADGLARKVEDFVGASWQVGLSEEQFASCLSVLCPDADFVADPLARARRTRAELQELCDQRISALVSLDQNRRVMVTGGAGTGKTRLALRWARRAARDEQRVLVVSYNDPLGAELAAELGDDENLTVGPFLRVARELPGLVPPPTPDEPDDHWWNHALPAHVGAHLDGFQIRFDTIVVDEAQDFSPAWISLLEGLLDGPDSRMFLLADPRQDLYGRGFAMPTNDQGWVRCDLSYNTRNTHAIAQLLRRRLEGAASEQRTPPSEAITAVEVTAHDAVIGSVDVELQRLRERGLPASSVLVATVSSAIRDELRGQLGLAGWGQGAGAAVCENVHRTKGTEFDHVILVAVGADGPCDGTEVSDELLYVGISRAVLGLTVIGGTAVLDRLGLEPTGVVDR